MTNCNFFHPLEIRYGDLDPQGHVNNAKYLTFFEQARIQYFLHLNLFEKGQSFMDIGVIMADAQVTFLAPILWENRVKVGVRTTRLGNKSMDVEQCILDAETGAVYATGKVVLVAYDYHAEKTVPIFDRWRQILTDFEGLAP